MYYIYLKRYDGTSTYVKEESIIRAMSHASWSFMEDGAMHVEISTNPPPVEGGPGVEWIK